MRKGTSKVLLEGWMVRYGRRKIGRSFFHKRFFVLESRVLAYYKKKPSENEVPIKSLLINGTCRVEDRGLETHHGHVVYVLSVYNKKDKSNRITMATFNLQDACTWKESIERVIDQWQYPGLHTINGNNQIARLETRVNTDHERSPSSSDQESLCLTPQEDEKRPNYARWENVGNVLDRDITAEPTLAYQTSPEIGGSRKHWQLVRCQNGMRIFEEISDLDHASGSRAMKAVGVVDAACDDIFALIVGMDETRYEWDSTFHYGRLVEEVDGHTAIFYHRLQIDWCNWLLWPRDLCYVRYWRRKDDGSYVVVYHSREHPNCPPQPGCVRAHIESGGFAISPLKSRAGFGGPRARVEHQIQIDLKGWGVGYLPFYQQSYLLQMLNNVAGLREWFAQRDDGHTPPSIHRYIKMGSEVAARKGRKQPSSSILESFPSLEQMDAMEGRMQDSFADEESEDDDDAQAVDQEVLPTKFSKESMTATMTINSLEGEFIESHDWSAFIGNLRRDDGEIARNCWSIPNGNNFRVRSKRFLIDRSKIPAGEPLLRLVAVDWFKNTKRMDHLARRKDCAAQIAVEKGLFTLVFNLQVPGATHYSMVLYFMGPIIPGSLLARFVDGDDDFRNSRLKLIPSISKGSWIVRQSVGSMPCILGKAVDCNYYRGKKYLEVDVDIGSSTVANGILGLVFGVVTSLVVDMAFLVQGNYIEELPERLIGAVRISRLELSSAVSLSLDTDYSS